MRLMLPLIEIDIDPVIAHIGPFALRWYSLMIAVGIYVGTMLAARFATQRGIDPDHVYAVAVWIVISGIAGARLTHVVDRWELYQHQPIRVFAVYEGGIAIWGGLIGGGGAVWAYAQRYGISFWPFADAISHAAIFGQAIGRLGCIVNGDVAGRPTGADWGFVYVNPGALLPKAAYLGVPTHPYPLYELVWDLALFALLFWVARTIHRDGAVFLTYTALYSLARLVLTVVREEEIWAFGLQQAQLVSLATIGLAVGLFLLRLRSRGVTSEVATQARGARAE
jgi:phosphatidylglycerol:prolipoprotein diacylglycerol transferase